MRPTVPRRLRPPRLYFRRQTVVRTAATRRHAVVIRRAAGRSSRPFRRRPGAVRVVADLPPGRFVGGSAALQKYIEPSGTQQIRERRPSHGRRRHAGKIRRRGF